MVQHRPPAYRPTGASLHPFYTCPCDYCKDGMLLTQMVKYPQKLGSPFCKCARLSETLDGCLWWSLNGCKYVYNAAEGVYLWSKPSWWQALSSLTSPALLCTIMRRSNKDCVFVEILMGKIEVKSFTLRTQKRYHVIVPVLQYHGGLEL